MGLEEKKSVIMPLLDELRKHNPSIGKYEKSTIIELFDYSVKLSNGYISLPGQLVSDYESSPGGITLEDLEAMIEQELNNYHLEPEFRDWALQILRENHQDEINKQDALIKENALAEQKILKELDVLIDMRVSSHITEEKYVQKKAEKDAQLIRIQEKKNHLHSGAFDWLDQLKQKLDFATIALDRFKSRDIHEQRDVCINFGWKWTLIGNKLIIDKFEWFEAIKEYEKAVEGKFDRLEPKKTFDEYGENASLEILRPIVCSR